MSKKKILSFLSLGLICSLFLVIAGCIFDTVEVTDFFITSEKEVYLTPHSTHQITYTISPSNASNKNINWKSTNPAVASVNNGGLVTAGTLNGQAIISGETRSGLKVDSIRVEVGNRATGINIDITQREINVGDMFYIVATVHPSNADNKTVTWSTSNSQVASVSQNGLVTGMGVGQVTITASTHNGHTADCHVTVRASVINPTDITLDITSRTINVGDSFTIVPNVMPANATDKTVTWATSNSSIATVTNGFITAVAAGTATITASTHNGLTADCIVTVNPVNDGVLDPPSWLELMDDRMLEIFWEPDNERWEYWIMYNSNMTMNSNSITLKVNNYDVQEHGVELTNGNTTWFSYGHIPNSLPGGSNVNIQFTTPEGVSNVFLNTPHKPLITSNPAFNPSAPYTTSWSLISGGDMQWIDFWAGDDFTDPLDYDLYLAFLRHDIRTHTVPAGWFKANETNYEYWVVNSSNNVHNNTLFLMTREDYRGNISRSSRTGNQNRINRFIRMGKYSR